MVERQDCAVADTGVGLNAVELLQVILKRKILIISICGATALLSFAYSLTMPNIYAATARVLPPQKEGAGLTSVLGQLGGIAGVAAGAAKGNDSELYLALLKSRSLGTDVIQRLELAKRYQTESFHETWKRLDEAVKVTAGRDGILTVTAEDRDPKQAALLANTLVDELGRTMVRLNLSKVGAERLFLEKRLELVKKDLKAAEDDLKGFAQRHKIAQVEAQAGATVNSAARLKSELASKETELAVLRTSQSDESFQVKELQAGIKRLRQTMTEVAGTGGGDGVPALGDVPGLGLEYARKMRDLKTQEALFEQLTKQYELAKLNEAKDSSSLQVLDEALPPEDKVRPRRSTVVLMATLASLICSVVLVLVIEFLERMSESQRKVYAELKRIALRW